MTIKWSDFEIPCLNKNPNLLNVSAFYGSINCFRYLILNGETINPLTFENSVCGGNLDIIHIHDSLQNQLSYSNEFLILAAKYRRNEIMDWIWSFSNINSSLLVELYENNHIRSV